MNMTKINEARTHNMRQYKIIDNEIKIKLLESLVTIHYLDDSKEIYPIFGEVNSYKKRISLINGIESNDKKNSKYVSIKKPVATVPSLVIVDNCLKVNLGEILIPLTSIKKINLGNFYISDRYVIYNYKTLEKI